MILALILFIFIILALTLLILFLFYILLPSTTLSSKKISEDPIVADKEKFYVHTTGGIKQGAYFPLLKKILKKK